MLAGTCHDHNTGRILIIKASVHEPGVPGHRFAPAAAATVHRPPSNSCGHRIRTLPGDRHARPVEDSRRSCRIADRLAEGNAVDFCSSRPPFARGGRFGKGLVKWWPLLGNRVLSPCPPRGNLSPPSRSPSQQRGGSGGWRAGRSPRRPRPPVTSKTICIFVQPRVRLLKTTDGLAARHGIGDVSFNTPPAGVYA